MSPKSFIVSFKSGPSHPLLGAGCSPPFSWCGSRGRGVIPLHCIAIALPALLEAFIFTHSTLTLVPMAMVGTVKTLTMDEDVGSKPGARPWTA